MGEFLIVFGIIFLAMALLVGLIYIPIMIANARGICGGERTAIIILSWFGILFGITWVVALILSLVWRGECGMRESNLDKLDKLSRLYKSHAISRAEYEGIKKKLLSKEQ